MYTARLATRGFGHCVQTLYMATVTAPRPNPAIHDFTPVYPVRANPGRWPWSWLCGSYSLPSTPCSGTCNLQLCPMKLLNNGSPTNLLWCGRYCSSKKQPGLTLPRTCLLVDAALPRTDSDRPRPRHRGLPPGAQRGVMDAGRVPQATASSVATASRQFATLEVLLDLVVADAPSLIHTGYKTCRSCGVCPQSVAPGNHCQAQAGRLERRVPCRDLVEQACDCPEAQVLLHR